MKIETEKLARKPLKDYDTDHNGNLDGDEILIFKQDCNKLYAAAYGEDSAEYKSISKRLEQTTISFEYSDDQGRLGRCDYENHKYGIALASNQNLKKLKDSEITLTDEAGILLHEEEHIQQKQKIYDKVRSDKGSKLKANMSTLFSYNGNFEEFAEIERMNFYKKLGTFSFADRSESYKKYVEESDKIGVDPNKDKKTFLEKFNFAEFAKVVKKQYLSLNFDDKKDKFALKDLLFE